MDSEEIDNSNNCATKESTDSSSINNNTILKEGVKKGPPVNNASAEDHNMEVDEEGNSSPNNKYSERKNGIHNETDKTENQNDIQSNNETASLNHDQNSVNKEDLSKNSLDSEESTSVQNKQNCANETSENKLDSNSNENENSEKSLNDTVCDGETPMNVDVSSDKDLSKNETLSVSTEKVESATDVRPTDKDSNAELIVSDGIEENLKSDFGKDSSDQSSSEIHKDEARSKDTKDKDVNDVTLDKEMDIAAPSKEAADHAPSEETTEISPDKKTVESIPSKEAIDSAPSKEATESAIDKDATDIAPSKEATDSEPSKEGTDSAPSKEATDSVSSKETSESAPAENKSESTKKEGESSGKRKKSKTCEECGVKKGLKFQVLFKGKTRFLCSDTCFKNFKSKQMQSKSSESSSAPAPEQPSAPASGVKEKCCHCQKDISEDHGYYPLVGDIKPLCSEECVKKHNSNNMVAKSCSQCKKVLEQGQNPEILTWETMVFCNEDCLGKFQSYLGSHCTCCQSPVPQASLGKYSVCFGSDIRQFCSCNCLDDFKKNLKVCSFCQTDLSNGIDSFLAPVGDKGQFKDFCSQNCMERYEVMNNISKSAPVSQVCTFCKKQGTFKIQVKYENDTYAICGDLCVAGFRCSRKIKDKMCDTCYNFFKMAPEKDLSFKFDGQSKYFCTKACMTLFVLSHRKIVACVSCKVKKYNFDMIEKTDINNQTQIFCSLNCLSLYRVSVNATSSKNVRCDHCNKNLPAQYHLTMSDGSVRNFCSYNCVMVFQNQYTNVCTLTTTAATRQTTASTSTSKTTSTATTPVISNVVSLATNPPRAPGATLIRNLVPTKMGPRPNMQPVAIIGSKIYSLTPSTGPVLSQNLVPPKLDADQPLSSFLASNDSKPATATMPSPAPLSTVTNASGQQVIREVIVKPPAPKSQKNKSVACKPIMLNKGINVKPTPCHKAVQTDDSPRPILIPIPVPIYIPTPLHMFSRPVPCPVPFPVPIPVPLIMPSSKESSNQERRTASAPVENVYSTPEESSQENLASRNDVSKEGDNFPKENDDNSEKEAAVNDADEPCSSDDYDEANNMQGDEYIFKDNKSHHHGKRSHHGHRSKGCKRSRTDDIVVEEAKTHINPPPEDNRNSIQNDKPEEAPHLKHTFGVNAWKQWVLQKNEQMVKGSQSSRKFKLFKTDLLKLPPDELNYSLSLFVKEVRKPNGEEYGSGSIYYLCLGIQKYLFQNGRLDNIFAEPHYEKFTECLNDILQLQDTLSSIEGIPSSRIEEEVLWESKQLGAHSPYALLNTLMYFNTKYFKLKKAEDHVRLSFTHVDIAWVDKNDTGGVAKLAHIRYYPKDPRKDTIDTPYYEQKENTRDSMRCPVKLYEFYLSKIPESCKGRNDMFYLHPDRSCCPDNAVWYSPQSLGHDIIAKMIQRIKIVQEIYEN